MKKSLLLAIIILGSSLILEAQKVYFQANAGYSFWVATDDLGSPLPEVGATNYLQNADGTILDKPLFGTLLKGPSLGLSLGYMFSENIGVDFSYYFARGSEFLDARIETPTYLAEQYSRSYGHTISPSLVLTAGEGKLSAYSKVGLLVPVAGAILSRAYVDDGDGIIANRLPVPLTGATFKLNASATSIAKPALGFKGTIGLEYRLNNRMAVFSDLTFGMLTLTAKETNFDEFTVDVLVGGELILTVEAEDLDPYYTSIKYQNSLNEQSNNEAYNANIDTSKPTDELIFKSNGNNLSLGIGFKYYIGKIEKDTFDK